VALEVRQSKVRLLHLRLVVQHLVAHQALVTFLEAGEVLVGPLTGRQGAVVALGPEETQTKMAILEQQTLVGAAVGAATITNLEEPAAPVS
jgi:hypothetical protein